MSGRFRAADVYHLDEGFPTTLWFSVCTALLGSLAAGYTIAVLNVPLDQVTTSGTLFGSPILLSSGALIGAVLGAAVAWPLAQVLGPRTSQHLNAAAYLLGSLMCTWDWAGHHGFLLGRVVTGLGAGATSVHVPIYLSDIAPRELRPTLLHQHQVVFAAGLLCAMLAGLPYQFVPSCTVLGKLQVPWWRVMVALGAVPAVLQLLAMFWCPESPSWLERTDKDKADEACIALWGARAILYEDEGTAEDASMPAIPADLSTGATHRALGISSTARSSHGRLAASQQHQQGGGQGRSSGFGGHGGFSHQSSGGLSQSAFPPQPGSYHQSGSGALAAGPPPMGMLLVARQQQQFQQQIAQYQQQQGYGQQQPQHRLPPQDQHRLHSSYSGWTGLSPDPSTGAGWGAAWWALGGAPDITAPLLDEGCTPQSPPQPPPDEGWGFLTSYEHRRFVMLALGLPVLQQASGATAVLLYSSQMFPELAWPEEFPAVWGCVAIAALYLTASSWSMPLADKYGRRPLLLASWAGMAACLFASAVITFFQDLQNPSSPTPPIPRPTDGEYVLDLSNSLLLLLFAFFLGLGAGPLLPRYLDELLPPRIKGRAMAAGTLLGWVASLAVGASFLPTIAGPMDIGGVYLIYGLFAVVALVMVALLCVETLGRTQAELDPQLRRRPQPQLRHLFPAPHMRRAGSDGFAGLWNGPGARGMRGPMGAVPGGPSSDVAVEATAAALAAQAWAKLMQHQAALEDAEDEDQKLSQSL